MGNSLRVLKYRMATVCTKPVLFILGSTGTGKSDLAIALAKRFSGEVINADAMQLYKGLDVVTNKVGLEQQYGDVFLYMYNDYCWSPFVVGFSCLVLVGGRRFCISFFCQLTCGLQKQ